MSIRRWAVLKLCISRGCYIMWCGVWRMEIASSSVIPRCIHEGSQMCLL